MDPKEYKKSSKVKTGKYMPTQNKMSKNAPKNKRTSTSDNPVSSGVTKEKMNIDYDY